MMQTSNNEVDRGRMRLALLTVGCLAIAWGWFAAMSIRRQASPALARGGTSQSEAGSYHGSKHAPASSEAVPPAMPPVLIREEVANTAIVLRVRDEAGAPISGAAVIRCLHGGARNLPQKNRVGITDPSGEMTIQLGGHTSVDPELLVVSARGMVSRSIICPSTPGRYEVTLQEGSTLEISCRDYSSTPLPRVHVAISMLPIAASVWRDTPPEDRDVGSDPTFNIMHGTTDESGSVVFEGLLPGDYFIKAESDGHLLVATNADEGAERKPLHVDKGTTRHVILCGQICVAALETNVPPPEILFYQISGAPSHIKSGKVQEALQLRRRDIEARFPNCQVALAVARGRSDGLGYATFRYSTLGHGDFVHEVPFVALDTFNEPEKFVAREVARPPTGEVILRIEGDHGVSRGKLRVELKRTRRSLDGIAIVEGEPRLVPVGQYVVDSNDRETAPALEIPPLVNVSEGLRQEVVLQVKEGLVPVSFTIVVPPLLKGQYCSLAVRGPDQKIRRGRTRGEHWLTWLPTGEYAVTADMAGCRPKTASLVVSSSNAASASIVMETNE